MTVQLKLFTDRLVRYGVDIDTLMILLDQRKVQLFEVPPRSIIIAGMTYKGRVHIYAAAGELQPLLTALPLLEQWYRNRGAEQVTIGGRKGWIRLLTINGYRQDGTLLRKELH